MKKLFGKFKSLSGKKRIIIALLIVMLLVISVSLLSMQRKVSIPEDAIVAERNENHGVIYKGRAYVKYSQIDKFSDITEKKIELDNSSTPMESDLSFYTIKGVSSDFAICSRSYDASLNIYVSLSETALYKGSDIYEEMFKMSENTVSYCYYEKIGQYNNNDYYRFKAENNEFLKSFFEYLNESEVFYKADFEETKDMEVESNKYYIEFEFENGFVYGVRIFDGGYIIPYGAPDICQKIPLEMYDELLVLLEDKNEAIFIENTEYKIDLNENGLEELNEYEELKPYLPSYIPSKYYVKYAGIVDNKMLSKSYVYYGYDKETGKITDINLAELSFSGGMGGVRFEIVIGGIEEKESYIKVNPKDITEEFLKENYVSKEEVDGFINYEYKLDIDYGEAVIRIVSKYVPADELYKTLNSIGKEAPVEEAVPETFEMKMPSFHLSSPNDHAPNCVIYNNRFYSSFNTNLSPETDIIGEFVGSVTWSDTLDGWNKFDYDVKLSSNVQRKIYTVEGADPEYILCSREEDGRITLFASLYEIKFSRGEDIYSEILKIDSENYHLEFENRDSYFYSLGEVYTAENSEKNAADLFINAINEASFINIEKSDIDFGESLYMISLVNADGFSYNFTLYENGYISTWLLNRYIQKLPDEIFDELKKVLNEEEKEENLHIVNRSPYYLDIEWLRDNTDVGTFIPTYMPDYVTFDRATIIYNIDEESGNLAGVKDMEMYFMKDQNWQNPYYVINILTKEASEEERGHVFRKIDHTELSEELFDEKYKDLIGCINISVSYGDYVIEYQSENIPAEDSYKILSSIK